MPVEYSSHGLIHFIIVRVILLLLKRKIVLTIRIHPIMFAQQQSSGVFLPIRNVEMCII